MSARFDVDNFVADVLAALDDPSPGPATQAVVQRTLTERTAILDTIGPKFDLRTNVLHLSADATITLSVFPAGVPTGPHNHGMWAVTGTCAGHEGTTIYRRRSDRIERLIERRLDPGDSLLLDRDAIHDVVAGGATHLYSIHVYPVSLASTPHSRWVGNPTAEQPFDAAEEWSRMTAALSVAGLLADA